MTLEYNYDDDGRYPRLIVRDDYGMDISLYFDSGDFFYAEYDEHEVKAGDDTAKSVHFMIRGKVYPLAAIIIDADTSFAQIEREAKREAYYDARHEASLRSPGV